jgi:hypothetical protein
MKRDKTIYYDMILQTEKHSSYENIIKFFAVTSLNEYCKDEMCNRKVKLFDEKAEQLSKLIDCVSAR